MSTDENDELREQGGWQPIPQGEYDADMTAFVQLPPEVALDGAPLEAPGHGYVPPRIASPGAWTGHEPASWPEPAPQAPEAAHDPNATGQWTFQAAPEPAPAPSRPTGQWTIPVAQGDLPDESGEYTTSALASQWTSGNPPATLPGGAPAPWATQAPAAAAEPEPAAPTEPDPEPVFEPAAGQAPEHAAGPAAEQAPEPAATPGPAGEPAEATVPALLDTGSSGGSDEHPHISYVLRVNGVDRPVTEAWIGESLLYVLRERLGLAGAKDGCSQGECGACNVQVDGRLVASCLVPAATAAGSEVRTVEGLATDGEPSDVQRALAKCGAVQCGFCIPGMAMTVHDLLEGNHAPSELETRQALCGNLCRCTGYRGVLDAVREVVAERDAAAAAAGSAAEARIPHQVPHPHDGGMA
ncbi:(2Fe-2S)-binding protein [Streptomyces sp. SP18CS02]|uniref:(2Fe-2S)-binding protein n=1 Tax=Streptomyces sp. SP18CS02 TaxID=3002531 RepID=UPI002E75A88B|nr:(2Fe-2S)-binding protein [Streptomyces sp. SP18CS02]MEE1752253.1 (2Fe-2S)-binding protein [Streptomyces sp. SP18CS02]